MPATIGPAVVSEKMLLNDDARRHRRCGKDAQHRCAGILQNTAISPSEEHLSELLSQLSLAESRHKTVLQKQRIMAQRVMFLKRLPFLPVSVFTSTN